ncbi:hypothetical protein LOTGIDRAFT_239493 [Lottia gigantea]|uniref:Ubiquitin-like domain-containing protein n=1 Tax=Lottia gigantea TaxID=225164 RepID=V4ACW3_LOTGI|nr:hypothetical protein LOTGIDRAFT_239493 [Lottia gigantea]ESO94692.1 hypothetical protein LOTGIDRAFT_239493 [Lottia gigantea]
MEKSNKSECLSVKPRLVVEEPVKSKEETISELFQQLRDYYYQANETKRLETRLNRIEAQVNEQVKVLKCELEKAIERNEQLQDRIFELEARQEDLEGVQVYRRLRRPRYHEREINVRVEFHSGLIGQAAERQPNLDIMVTQDTKLSTILNSVKTTLSIADDTILTVRYQEQIQDEDKSICDLGIINDSILVVSTSELDEIVC